MALAFLPDADVPGIFDELRKDCDDDDIVGLRQFHFSNPWVSGYFAISLWNQYDVPARNAVETWHSRFNGVVRVAHPNVYVFCGHRGEECNTYQILLTLRASY